MRHLILTLTAIFLFFCFAGSLQAAESTVNCHCFTDRVYDHQNPDKVVPYFLATTQNSFLAVAFNAQKFKLVKALMNGVPSDQLWNTHYFSARTGYDTRSMITMRKAKGDWAAVLKEVGFSEEKLPPNLKQALSTKDDQKIASAVVDETLLQLMQVDAEKLQQVRLAGADNRETILSFFFEKRTDQEAPQIFKSVKDNSTNWGTLAFVNNIDIGEMEEEFKRLLKK